MRITPVVLSLITIWTCWLSRRCSKLWKWEESTIRKDIKLSSKNKRTATMKMKIKLKMIKNKDRKLKILKRHQRPQTRNKKKRRKRFNWVKNRALEFGTLYLKTFLLITISSSSLKGRGSLRDLKFTYVMEGWLIETLWRDMDSA